MKRLAFTVCLLASALVSVAQTLTYDEAQRLAKENYPLIKRYGLISQTEQLTLSNISKGWLPQVSAHANATYQSDVMSLPEAMEQLMASYGSDVLGLKKDHYDVGISVSQQVYDGGAISAQRRVTKAQTKVDEAQNDVDLYAVRESVDEIFFSILLTDERLDLNKEHQILLESNEDKLRKMAGGGVATLADADAVKAERLTARQQQTQLESTRRALLQVLSIYVGQDVDGVERPSEPESLSLGGGDMAMGNRPELELFNQRLALADAQEKALKSGLLPKLGVFAEGFYGYPGYNTFEDMLSHDWSWNGMIGAKLTWDIGSLYTNSNDKRKIAAQRQDIETARETFLFNTRLQSANESETIRGYRDMIAEDDDIIALRRGVRQSAEAKLNHGIVDVNDLLQEINRENQALINKSTHEVEMLQHIYSLKHIKGL